MHMHMHMHMQVCVCVCVCGDQIDTSIWGVGEARGQFYTPRMCVWARGCVWKEYACRDIRCYPCIYLRLFFFLRAYDFYDLTLLTIPRSLLGMDALRCNYQSEILI